MSPRQTQGGSSPWLRVAVQCPLCLKASHRVDRIGVLFEGRTVRRNGGPPASVLSCGDCGHRWHGPPVAELRQFANRGAVSAKPDEPPSIEPEDPLDADLVEPQDWEP